MIDPVLLAFAAFSLGMFGSLHCVAMCGGISCALGSTSSIGESATARMLSLFKYNAGRISSYSLIGFVAGSGGYLLVDQWQSLTFVLRMIAGGLLVMMGLYVAGISRLLARLEGVGYRLWNQYVLSTAGSLGQSATGNGFALGFFWGWLPCGLVYSTLLWATAEGQGAWQSAWLMLCFGLGTLPAMLGTGYFGDSLRSLVSARSVRWAAGLCIVLLGLWTMGGAFGHGSHTQHPVQSHEQYETAHGMTGHMQHQHQNQHQH